MSAVITISATQARKSFFDLLNAAQYGGQTTLIKKNGKVVAEIAPLKPKVDWQAYLKVLEKMEPILTKEDVKDIKAVRKSFKNRFPNW